MFMDIILSISNIFKNSVIHVCLKILYGLAFYMLLYNIRLKREVQLNIFCKIKLKRMPNFNQTIKFLILLHFFFDLIIYSELYMFVHHFKVALYASNGIIVHTIL